jgi:hypothetical protein
MIGLIAPTTRMISEVGRKTVLRDQLGNVSMMYGYTVVIAKMPKPRPKSSITTLAPRTYQP